MQATHSTQAGRQARQTIVIEKASFGAVQALAKNEGLILDAAYGHGQDCLEVRYRKSGIRGNHEPKWTQEQRDAFNAMFGQFE